MEYDLEACKERKKDARWKKTISLGRESYRLEIIRGRDRLKSTPVESGRNLAVNRRRFGGKQGWGLGALGFGRFDEK